MNFLKKAWNTLLIALSLDEDTLHVPDSHEYPTEPTYPVSPHVIHHVHNLAYLNAKPAIAAAFEEDYVDVAPRKKSGPVSKYASEEEKKAARKAWQVAYHKKRYADPAYRQQKVDYMRKLRGKTADTVQGYSRRHLGISAKENPQAYGKAYYEQVKKTGNTAATFNKVK